MDKLLDTAYRATTFVAETPFGEIDIRVGQRHPKLDYLLERFGSRSWVFITACNPASVRLLPEENKKRHNQLVSDIPFYYTYFLAEGRPDKPGWPPEPSVLILGIEREKTVQLGQDYGQHAIVIGQRCGEAELIWLPQRDDSEKEEDGAEGDYENIAYIAEDSDDEFEYEHAVNVIPCPPVDSEERGQVPPTEENGAENDYAEFAYIPKSSEEAFSILKEKLGIEDLKDMKFYIDAVYRMRGIPYSTSSIAYFCWCRVGNERFDMQLLDVGVDKDSSGRAVAKSYHLRFGLPRDSAGIFPSSATDVETSLGVICETSNQAFTLTEYQISIRAMRQIRKDLKELK